MERYYFSETITYAVSAESVEEADKVWDEFLEDGVSMNENGGVQFVGEHHVKIKDYETEKGW
jgi:pentatricopeptide repeat protein